MFGIIHSVLSIVGTSTNTNSPRKVSDSIMNKNA